MEEKWRTVKLFKPHCMGCGWTWHWCRSRESADQISDNHVKDSSCKTFNAEMIHDIPRNWPDYDPIAAIAVPNHTLEGLIEYVVNGTPPGDFIRSLLRNDLVHTIGMADHINLPNMHAICQFVYMCMPQASWGSEEKINAWLKKKDEERQVRHVMNEERVQ